jgi:hypothetical protein
MAQPRPIRMQILLRRALLSPLLREGRCTDLQSAADLDPDLQTGESSGDDGDVHSRPVSAGPELCPR